MAKIRFEVQGRYVSPTTIVSGNHSLTNNLMVIDNGGRRELRYCETEKSIWKDEQNEKSLPTKIFFTNGILEVDEDENPTLIDFLRTNEKNGLTYKEIDLSNLANTLVEKEELIHNAKSLIFGATEQELSSVVQVLIPSIKDESIGIIKQSLLSFATEQPDEVISKLGTKEAKDETDLEALVKQAFDTQILIVNEEGTEILWGLNKEFICKKAKTKQPLEIAVNFFKAEGNVSHKDLLIQRLTKDDK